MVLVVGPGVLLHAAGPAKGGTTSNGPAAHGYPLGAALLPSRGPNRRAHRVRSAGCPPGAPARGRLLCLEGRLEIFQKNKILFICSADYPDPPPTPSPCTQGVPGGGRGWG